MEHVKEDAMKHYTQKSSHDHQEWLVDIFSSENKEELLFMKIKQQIIDSYNLEKKLATKMALDIVETLSALDVNTKALNDYILQ
jgi:hypothetical protein